MNAPDWVPEPSSVALPTSSDLFEGELYGEELIDLYSSAVGEGVTETASIHQEVPDSQEGNNTNNNDSNLLIPNPEGGALGEFHPSASFNVTNTLLPGQAQPNFLANASNIHSTGGKSNSSGSVAGVKRETGAAPPGAPPAKMPVTAPLVKQEPIVSHIAAPSQIMPAPASTTILAQAAHAATYQLEMPPPAPVAPVASAPVLAPPTKAAPKASKATGKIASKPSASVKVAIVASTKPPSKKAPPKGTQSARTTKTKKKSTNQPDFCTGSDDDMDDFDGLDMSGACTEADFKSVAEAAVSSLIQNTKENVATAGTRVARSNVDTSTAHVKALTGTNWVAAFAGPSVAPVAPAPGPDTKANKSRKNLSADERARQNRDRNREHARNTRLRKKAYVEELKKTLTELVAQRDLVEVGKSQAAQRELEQREVRFRVTEEFLNLRGSNESNFNRWAAILEDGFTFTLPATSFREMVNTEQKKDDNSGPGLEQVLTGVSEVMADSINFAAFLQALGSDGFKGSENDPITFQYHCDRANFFMDGNSAVLDWTANSVGSVQKGGKAELFVRGSIRTCFSPASNKLLSANMMLDTGSILSQLHDLIDAHRPISAADVAAAAQAASHEADAILDSIQMPHFDATTTRRVPVSTASTTAPTGVAPATVSCAASVTSSDESL